MESFFAWWKRHLAVYAILARSEYDLKVQNFTGLITYLFLAIYCYQEHGEKNGVKVLQKSNRILLTIGGGYFQSQDRQTGLLIGHRSHFWQLSPALEAL